MSKQFRSAAMGFNKKDVIEYIERLAKEKNDAIGALEQENSRLEKEAGRICEMERHVSELEEARNTLLAEKGGLEASLDEMDLKAQDLDRQLKLSVGELESIQDDRDRLAAEAEVLKQRLEEMEEENRSLKKHNLRLLEVNESLERHREEQNAGSGSVFQEKMHSASELFELFKARIIEISAELSSLAQAITDAEKREKPREEDIIDHQDKMPGNLQDETSIEIEGYPIAERQKVSPGISVREIIEKVKAIGDRLL